MFHVQKKHNLSNFWYLLFFYFRYAFWVDRTDTSHKNRQMHSAKTWQNLPIHALLMHTYFSCEVPRFPLQKKRQIEGKICSKLSNYLV